MLALRVVAIYLGEGPKCLGLLRQANHMECGGLRMSPSREMVAGSRRRAWDEPLSYILPPFRDVFLKDGCLTRSCPRTRVLVCRHSKVSCVPRQDMTLDCVLRHLGHREGES